MAGKWIYWFQELAKEHNDLVGKKCANLGEMTKVGLAVPQGFALSLEGYKLFMELTGAGTEIAELVRGVEGLADKIGGLNELSRTMRMIVESKPMPPEMEEVITFYYQELCSRCGIPEVPVSTRSAGAVSRPGQYETHLNVKGTADVLEHIKKVWSSSLNPVSLAFRMQKGEPLGSEPIGVAVLKMVNARVAGIIFTAEPNSGDTSKVIIEANWGLGESVVGGECMPDTYMVDRKTLTVAERRLGAKQRCVLPTAKGVVELAQETDRACTFCLTDEEAIEIAKIGIRLEEHFGAPQDAEWAIDNDLIFPDSIIWLQTRNEVLAKKKEPVDQLLDLMTSSFIKAR
jgi:pyruvate, water dikinase